MCNDGRLRFVVVLLSLLLLTFAALFFLCVCLYRGVELLCALLYLYGFLIVCFTLFWGEQVVFPCLFG